MKAKTITQLRKQADVLFSKMVRMRDCDGYGFGECITCGVKKAWKEAHCGHFQSRRFPATRWDEMNCNLQCLTAESNLKMFNGTHKSITNIQTGDELWAFNESSYELEKAVVENVKSFTPQELYEVELENGSKFWATGDHRVVSNGKWTYIKDMLHNVSTHDILEL